MGKKYKVMNSDYEYRGLKMGDIVTKVEGSIGDTLYELPKHLYGKGYNADIYDKHLNLKENNYIYIHPNDLEEIEELENDK